MKRNEDIGLFRKPSKKSTKRNILDSLACGFPRENNFSRHENELAPLRQHFRFSQKNNFRSAAL